MRPLRVLLCPDSFKGSLDAVQVAEAMAAGVRQVCPGAEVACLPLADGGEGSLQVLAQVLGGPQYRVPVVDACGQPWEAPLLWLSERHALLEVATVVGLAQAGDTDPMQRSSAGVGLLIRQALEAGATHISVALGGSSVNDGGLGLLVALGAQLTPRAAAAWPTAQDLLSLQTLDTRSLDPRLAQLTLTLLSDVDNPLCGPQGATRVFARQKGFAPPQQEALEAAMCHWATLGDAWAGWSASAATGSGAAGGIGYALRLLGARQQSGADWMLQQLGAEAKLAWADWVVTGEGRSDLQTLAGKLPWRVAVWAQRQPVPVSLLSGGIDPAAREALQARFQGCFSIAEGPADLSAMQAATPRLLQQAAASMTQLFCAGWRPPQP